MFCPGRFVAALPRLLREEDGPTAVEYAVLLGLIVVVAIVAGTQLCGRIDVLFRDLVAVFPS